MLKLIETNRVTIESLCRKYAVKRLELFGSAVRGEFNPNTSDIDFFVEFIDYTTSSIADQWFGLQEDLQTLFGVPVELVSPRTAANPYFLKVVNRERVTLFAA